MPKPFVSFDGADENGVRAEVFVQTGTGVIEKIEGRDDDKRNAKVVIKSDNAKVSRPIQGWLAKDDPLFAVVCEAFEQGRTVTYRAEAQRKQGKDRTTPIAELRPNVDVAKENCINIIAGIDGMLSTEALTNPAEDPQPGGRIRATEPARAQQRPQSPNASTSSGVDVEAALTAVVTARRAGLSEGVVDAAVALALAAGATAQQVSTAGVEAVTPQQRPEHRAAVAVEAAPFTAYNTDGRVNLGSYAVSAAFAAERFAYEMIKANHEAVAAAAKADVEPVHLGQALGMARVILHIADAVQVGAYGGGKPNRMRKSHNHARSLVFDAIRERHPIPFGKPDEQNQWRENVIAEATERFRGLVAASQDVADVPVAGDADSRPTDAESAEQAGPVVAPTAEPVAASTGPDHVAAASEATPASEAARQVPPHEGEAGFEAPDDTVAARFAALCRSAGFPPVQGSPVASYLMSKFGVEKSRAVHGPALDALTAFYENHDNGTALFAEHVNAAAGARKAA